MKKSTPPAIDLQEILGSAARSGDARYHLNCCTQLTRISEVLGGRETFTRSELSGFGPKALIDLATSPSSPELPAREFRAFSQGGELRPRDLGMDPSTEATVGAGNHIFGAMSLSQSSASGDGADVRFGQTRSFGDVCSMSAVLERTSIRAIAMSQKCQLRTRAVQQKRSYSITSLRVLSFIAH